MTATPELPPPAAGFMDALACLYILRALPHIAALERALDESRNLNHRLRTARDFADSDAAGYIDRTGLEEL
ncbi:hypothetical protein ABZ725_14055 [Streptomyces sp. NPDC006872]|uniref:hypothetical protein n=1 Tax=Streptomyces sp. NPDC006872 TaxID=3155720 RepID=UPI0033EB0FD7